MAAWHKAAWVSTSTRRLRAFRHGLIIAFLLFGAGLTAAQDSDQVLSEPPEDIAPGGNVQTEGRTVFTSPQSNTGAFNHSISLSFPETFPSVSPDLQLQYSSHAGLGIVGVGWDLPQPAITLNWAEGRRPAALEDDLARFDAGTPVERYTSGMGKIAAVSYDDEISFLFSPNNDVRIQGHGRYGTDVGHWVATTKQGLSYQFGSRVDSDVSVSISTSGRAHKVAWMLDEVRDVHGNSMRYHYEDVADSGQGEQRVVKYIEYGITAARQSPAELNRYVIEFRYKSSRWHGNSYRLGKRTSFNKVLSHLCLYARSAVASPYIPGWQKDLEKIGAQYDPNAPTRISHADFSEPMYCYVFRYDFDESNRQSFSGRPLLTSVHRESASGETERPWEFEYTGENIAWQSALRESIRNPEPDRNFWEHEMPDFYTFLSTSTHDTTQKTVDLNGDGIVDVLYGSPNDSFRVSLGTRDGGFVDRQWPNPLARHADPVSMVGTRISTTNNNFQPNCYAEYEYRIDLQGGGARLGYAKPLTNAPEDFFDIYNIGSQANEYESGYLDLGAFQFLSNTYYGPYPSQFSESPLNAADTIGELETYGAYRDRAATEYAFDWRTSDCQDVGQRVEIDYCWDVGTGRTGILGQELGCLDYAGSRWFTDDLHYQSYASTTWDLFDINADGYPDWVYSAYLMQRDRSGALRDFLAGENDWYVALGNGNGWDAPIIWRVPPKDGSGHTGIHFIHSTGLLSTSTAQNSAGMRGRAWGVSVCAGYKSFSASPIIYGQSIPTSPWGAATAIAGEASAAAIGPNRTSTMMTGVSAVNAARGGPSSLLPSACFDITNQGVTPRAYLPILGDVIQRFQGTLDGSVSFSHQDLIDFDGDGRRDIISSKFQATPTAQNDPDTWLVIRNNGLGFEDPFLAKFAVAPQHPAGTTNSAVSSLQDNFTFRYQKTKFFPDSGAFTGNSFFGAVDQTSGFVDMNGDGLQDFVTTLQGMDAERAIFPGTPVRWNVYFNNGDGFEPPVQWEFDGGFSVDQCNSVSVQPIIVKSVFYEDPNSKIVRDGYVRQVMGLFDVNADGLLDYWYLEPYDGEAGIGQDGNCAYLPGDQVTSNTTDQWISYTSPYTSNSALVVRLNDGEKFGPRMEWVGSGAIPLSGGRTKSYLEDSPRKIGKTFNYGVVGVMDLNGDGVMELATSKWDIPRSAIPVFELRKIQEENVDRLRSIKTPHGGELVPGYEFVQNEGMGRGMWVVSSVETRGLPNTDTDLGGGVLSRIRYEYENGKYALSTRQFAGFERVYKYSDNSNGFTVSKYLQTPNFEGLLSCTETREFDAQPAALTRRSESTSTRLRNFIQAANTYRAGKGEKAAAQPIPLSEPTTRGLRETFSKPRESKRTRIRQARASGAAKSIVDWRAHLYGTCDETSDAPELCVAPRQPVMPVCGDPEEPGKLIYAQKHRYRDLSKFDGIPTPRQVRTDQAKFDKNGQNPRWVAESLVYDGRGNVTSRIDRGDTKTARDNETTTTTYLAPNDTQYLDGFACRVTITSVADGKIADTYFAYDNAGSVSCDQNPPTRGLVTAERSQVDQAKWISTANQYTAEGMHALAVDGRGHSTVNRFADRYPWKITRTQRAVEALTGVTDLTDPVLATRTVNHVEKYEYWGHGDERFYAFDHLKTHETADGIRLRHTYDELQRPTQIFYLNESRTVPRTIYSYQTASLPVSVTEKVLVEDGGTVAASTYFTATEYQDGFDRTYRVVQDAQSNADGATQLVEGEKQFDVHGRVRRLWLPRWSSDGNNLSIDNKFNQMGYLTESRGPNGDATRYEYDRERVLTRSPSGRTRLDIFDARNNLVSRTHFDQRGDRYRSERIIRRTDGKIREIVDEHKNQWSNEYDFYGRVVLSKDPDSGARTLFYDDSNNITVSYDERYSPAHNMQANKAVFDAHNRPIVESQLVNAGWNPQGEFVGTPVAHTFRYYDTAATAIVPEFECSEPRQWVRTIGRLSVVENYVLEKSGFVRTGQKAFCYDERGRVSEKRVVIDKTAYHYAFRYNANGQVVAKKLPDGTQVTIERDATGQKSAVLVDGQAVVSAYQYAPHGAPTSRVLPAIGLKQFWCYQATATSTFALHRYEVGDDAAQVECDAEQRDHRNDSSSITNASLLLRETRSYNSEAQVIEKQSQYRTGSGSQLADYEEAFKYDFLGRLLGYTRNQVAQAYQYDEIDNLVDINGQARCFGGRTCNGGAAPSRPHQLNSDHNGASLSYDPAGNLLTWQVPGTADIALTYNSLGYLTQIEDAQGRVQSNWFDETGERIARTTPGVVDHFPDNGTVYRAANGEESAQLHIEQGVLRQVSDSGNPEILYDLGTLDGSINVRVDSGAQVVKSAFFDPWAEKVAEQVSGGKVPPAQYRSRFIDDELFAGRGTVVDHGARYYSSSMKTWMSVDPFFEDGLNRYAYSRNDPVNWIDPEGAQNLLLIFALKVWPDWDKESKQQVHTWLDRAGMSPEPISAATADCINACLYAVDGDYVNATISGISVVNGVGDLAKGPRMAKSIMPDAPSSSAVPRLPSGSSRTPSPAQSNVTGSATRTSYNNDLTKKGVNTVVNGKKGPKQRRIESYRPLKDIGAPPPGYGVIYYIPPLKGTPSGKPYVGRANDMAQRIANATDGRNRNAAIIVAHFPLRQADTLGKKLEQEYINRFGLKNLDNHRHEIAEHLWDALGVKRNPWSQ